MQTFKWIHEQLRCVRNVQFHLRLCLMATREKKLPFLTKLLLTLFSAYDKRPAETVALNEGDIFVDLCVDCGLIFIFIAYVFI